jgi:hypothetical protein
MGVFDRGQGDKGRQDAAPLQTGRARADMRLELVRIAHRHDHDASDIVERAKVLEAYVFGDQTTDKA